MRKKYQGPGRVIVQHGINVREQSIGSEKGAYFSGQSKEYDTNIINPKGTASWRIILRDIETEEIYQKRFRVQIIIGRSPETAEESRVVLKGDLRVSKNHCMIFDAGDRLYVKDLESKNATYLNGVRLTQTAELRNGDILRIGSRRFKVEYGRG